MNARAWVQFVAEYRAGGEGAYAMTTRGKLMWNERRWVDYWADRAGWQRGVWIDQSPKADSGCEYRPKLAASPVAASRAPIRKSPFWRWT